MLVVDQEMRHGQSFCQAIKVNVTAFFRDMSSLFNVCFQKTDSLLFPPKTAIPRNCFHFCLQSVSVNLSILVSVLKDSSITDQSYIP